MDGLRTLLPILQKKPALHSLVGKVRPANSQYMPGRHRVQSVMFCPCVRLLNVPDGQATGASEAPSIQKLPAGQGPKKRKEIIESIRKKKSLGYNKQHLIHTIILFPGTFQTDISLVGDEIRPLGTNKAQYCPLNCDEYVHLIKKNQYESMCMYLNSYRKIKTSHCYYIL